MTNSPLEISFISSEEDTLYVGTSTGKVISVPMDTLELMDSSTKSLTIQKHGAIAVHSHRDAVCGLLHVSLPDNLSPSFTSPFSNSMHNLAAGRSLTPATSLPSLLMDSPTNLNNTPITPTMTLPQTPSLNQTPANLTVYHSLLVSAGKGHRNYLSKGESYEENMAIRERNDAHQLIVWGYPNT